VSSPADISPRSNAAARLRRGHAVAARLERQSWRRRCRDRFGARSFLTFSERPEQRSALLVCYVRRALVADLRARRRHGPRLAFTSARVSRAWFVAGCVPRAEVSSAVVAGVETAPDSWQQQSPGARLNFGCPTMREPTRSSAWWCASTPPSESWCLRAGGSGLLGWPPVRSSARLDDERQPASRGHNDSPSTGGRQDNHNPRRVNNHRPDQAPGDRVRGAAERGDRRRSGHLRLNLDRHHAL
jgi:hypothetical protein